MLRHKLSKQIFLLRKNADYIRKALFEPYSCQVCKKMPAKDLRQNFYLHNVGIIAGRSDLNAQLDFSARLEHSKREPVSERICSRCFADFPFYHPLHYELLNELLPVICVCRYEGAAASLVRQAKFKNQIKAAELIGQMVAMRIGGKMNADYRPDAVVAMPLAPERLRDRGYNQTGALADAVAERFKVTRRDLLKKEKNTQKQTAIKGVKNRFLNVENAYALDEKESAAFMQSFYYKRKSNRQRPYLLLVDDVLTTGATMLSAAGVLIDEGFDVAGLCFAKDNLDINLEYSDEY